MTGASKPVRAVVIAACLVAGTLPATAQDDPFRSAAPLAPNADPFRVAPAPAPPRPPKPLTGPAAAEEPPSIPNVPATPTGVALFDGTYKGGAPPVAVCVATIEQIDVLNGLVSGNGYNDRGQSWVINGAVIADGSFTGTHARSVLTGHFQNGTFEGTYLSTSGKCGRRTLTMQRTSTR